MLDEQLKEDLKEILIFHDKHLAQLEACRRIIICQLQQQQPVVDPFQKLKLFEEKIQTQLSVKWEWEALLSKAGVKF